MACRTTAARLLGVAPNASARRIQAAFRKKALETHPDRKGGSAAQFLAARDAADLLLRPESQPSYVPPRAAPQPSHTTDARAVAHRTIRSLDEELAAERAVRDIRRRWPDIPVYARARDLGHAADLEAAGATRTIPELAESSLQMGAFVLGGLGVPPEAVNTLVDRLRTRGYEGL